MSDHWEVVKRLVCEALERPTDQRAAFLDSACGDPDVRQEVDALLEADARAGDFLAAPVSMTAGSDGDDSATRCILTKLCPNCRVRYGPSCEVCPFDGAELVDDPAALVNTTLDDTYVVVALLDAGGMGDVYLATDTRLRRHVALKFLPDSVSRDEGRLRRFEVEARAAAKLSHPNVCMVYGLGATDDNRRFIAMEYVDGRSLRARLSDGPLPLEEALDVARQVAHALAAAHEAGVVHCDVKPENVMLRPDGYVKVLDFGLAKLAEVMAPLETGGATTVVKGQSVTRGVVGTLGYMSPEQARGRSVDARSDVFSFGAVLYELLIGEAAFAGTSDAESVHATLREDPARLAELENVVPAGVVEVVRRCLEKSPERRYANGTALAAAVDEQAERLHASGATADVAPGRWFRRRWWLALAGAAAIGGGVWLLLPRHTTTDEPGSSVQAGPMKIIRLTSLGGFASAPKFSPDGKQIAFVVGAEGSDAGMYVQLLDGGAVRKLATAPGGESPTWSPDNQSIAYVGSSGGQRAIYTVPVLGGPARKLVAAKRKFVPWDIIDWSSTGELIAYSDADERVHPWCIHLVVVATGETRQLTVPADARLGAFGDWAPAFSPDGQTLAFIRALGPAVADVYVLPVAGGEPQRLTFDGQHVIGVSWTPDGRSILFGSARSGAMTLWRISAEGGQPEPLEVAGAPAFFPVVTRDGSRLAYTTNTSASSTWRVNLARRHGRSGPPVKLFTSTPGDGFVQFSPDGRRIAFTSNRSGGQRLWVCESDGSNPLPVPGLCYAVLDPPSWSPDGRLIAFACAPQGNSEIYVTGADGGIPRRVTDHPGDDHMPTWSHDGRWIYFLSDRTGDLQVWKASPGGGEAVRVTQDGGSSPAFESSDGAYIYYQKKLGVPGLWRMHADSGAEELVSDRRWPYLFDPSVPWAFADNGVYFQKDADGVETIAFYSFATRRVTRIAKAEKLTSMGVAPDGRSLYYTCTDRFEFNIVLVDNIGL